MNLKSQGVSEEELNESIDRMAEPHLKISVQLLILKKH